MYELMTDQCLRRLHTLKTAIYLSHLLNNGILMSPEFFMSQHTLPCIIYTHHGSPSVQQRGEAVRVKSKQVIIWPARNRERGGEQVLVTRLKSWPLLSTGILIVVPPCVGGLYWIPLFSQTSQNEGSLFPSHTHPLIVYLTGLGLRGASSQALLIESL